jgi:hypothetical protein
MGAISPPRFTAGSRRPYGKLCHACPDIIDHFHFDNSVHANVTFMTLE